MSAGSSLGLVAMPGAYTVCRFDPSAPVPAWVAGPFTSITRSSNELSVVCRADRVPAEVPGEDGWRCLYLDDTFDLSQVGVIRSVIEPLADAGVAVFTIATFDTDYVLVRRFEAAVAALRAAGHEVTGDLD
ncbi:ACT domain-containing protein [soil metagenome]